ncbi:MAG TPA: hypothetical protein VIX63_14370 [Vicinamibacterales bacterium]
MEVCLARDRRSGIPVLAVALALILVGATGAAAQDIQTFPGSSCQASGSTQDLYYSGVLVANRGNITRSAVCPLVRRNGTENWVEIVVYVRDRHSTLNITCTALARDRTGIAGTGWSDTRSSAGEGDQEIVFPAPGVGLPDYGPYVVTCSLPPMEEVNQPSWIASITLEE